MTYKLTTLTSVLEFSKVQNVFIGQASVLVATDISITVLMVWALSERLTGVKQTDTLLQSIMKYFIASGFFSTAITIATLAVLVHYPHAAYHELFYPPLCFIYQSATLMILNNRDSFRGALQNSWNSEARKNSYSRDRSQSRGVASGITLACEVYAHGDTNSHKGASEGHIHLVDRSAMESKTDLEA